MQLVTKRKTNLCTVSKVITELEDKPIYLKYSVQRAVYDQGSTLNCNQVWGVGYRDLT